MRRIILTLLSSYIATQMVLAGGIVTNTNQSAAFIRMPAQDAATGIHAAYHNPAALTKLADGFHIQVGNQSIIQSREIENSFVELNNNLYKGDVAAPVYPMIYAAYKTGKLAFSVGVNPIGGGGSAEFKTGLPSFEAGIAAIPEVLTKDARVPTSKYSADVYFKGTSVYWGIQGGVSYAINDMISVYGGVRYVLVQNTYEGYIRNVLIDPSRPDLDYADGSWVAASDFAKSYAETLDGAADAASGAAAGMQLLVEGAGALTFAQAEGATAISAAQRQQLEGGLLLLGVSQEQINQMTIAEAQAAYSKGAVDATNGASGMRELSAQTADTEVEATQTGSGISPIVGVHLTLMEDKLNIGMKYEHQATIEIENDTKGIGLAADQFPNGAKVPSDVPSMFALGASYKVLPEFRAAAGFHYYLDKPAKYGRQSEPDGNNNREYITNEDLLDQNSWELAVGLEYDVSQNITLSGGWLFTNTSPTLAYQNEQTYILKSNGVSFGAQGRITDAFSIDIGIMHIMYQDGEKNNMSTEIPNVTMNEIYRKSATSFAIGFSYSFGAGE